MCRLLAPGQDSPRAFVTEEGHPPDALDRPSWFGWLLGRRTPTTVRRVVVRTAGGALVLMLQHLPPIFQEVVRVYDAEGKLIGRCLSYHKQSLRAGFRIDDVQGWPIATVPFFGSSEAVARLLRAGTEEVIGTIRWESADSTSARFRVSADSDAPAEQLFLLAAAVTLGVAGWTFRLDP